MNGELLCLLPGEDEVRTFARRDYDIRPWGGEGAGLMPVAGESTSFEEYAGMVNSLKFRFTDTYVKAVLCRIICGSFRNRLETPEDIKEIGMAVMRPSETSLGFFFGDAQSGRWAGMTPELLLRREGDGLGTQALAGTRLAGMPEPWSEKNLTEHRYVVDDMLGRLSAYHCTTDSGTLRHGVVEHLCTRIHIDSEIFNCDTAMFLRIADALHPTPAIGGLPRDKALEDIATLERVPRNYYGGVMYLREPELAYVILRCVHFDNEKWCIYTGSGITAASDARKEWDETREKAQPLLEIMKRF